MAFMYILMCADDTFYTGSTIDLNRRVKEHMDGKGANYTSARLPVKLVYQESYKRVSDAFKREKQIQRWSHKKKQALIEANHSELHVLAICQNESRAKSVVVNRIKPE
jgi:putative endonuclease